MNGLIGRKQNQTQGFLQDGTRVPLTVVSSMGNWVTQVKTADKDGYASIQLGFDIKKKPNKALQGHSKKAGIEKTPRFFREIEADAENVQPGTQINPSDVFKPGDIVDVTGVSKGKGFAGVVKRHHFKGGPRTHGQSDRERAPGSIGQTTTPGHVYRGKRMAGRMGHDTVTIKNLEVIDVTADGAVLIRGLVPGPLNSIVVVKKVGEDKKFVPLYREVQDETKEIEEPKVEVQTPQETVQAAAEVKTTEQVQTGEEVSSDAKAMEDKKENAS